MKRRIRSLILSVIVIITCFSLSGCIVDHDDGKCDICGKASTYSGSEEEYCDKHLKSAIDWYIKQ